MKKEDIQKRIDEILLDSRLLDKTANVFVNAPLALIQYSLETELHTLQKVLDIELTNIKKIRHEI
jgi:hypothetical protein